MLYKKLLLLCCIGSIHITTAFSQTKEKDLLSVSIGPAFAMSKFAGSNASDPSAGLAKTGAAIAVSWSKMLSPYIGIAVQVQGQYNPVNTTALKKLFEDQTGYSNWTIDKAGWLYGALLAGPQSQMPIDEANKMQFVARVMAGIAYAKSPGITAQSKNANTAGDIQQNKKTATGFILSTMAGLHYSVNNSVLLTAALSYSGTNKMTFKQVKTITTTSQGTPGTPEYSIQRFATTVDEKQSISSLNVLVGVAFRL